MKIQEFVVNRFRNWKTTYSGLLTVAGGLSMFFSDVASVFQTLSQGHLPDAQPTVWAFAQAVAAISAGVGLVFAKDAAVSGTATTPVPEVVPPVKG